VKKAEDKVVARLQALLLLQRQKSAGCRAFVRWHYSYKQ